MCTTSRFLLGTAFALTCLGHTANSEPILVEVTGSVDAQTDALGVFPDVGIGEEVTLQIIFDRSLADATTVTVLTGQTQVLAEGITPIVGPDSVQFFGVLPEITGLEADGGVIVSLALPTTNPLNSDAFEAADLQSSLARVSYATLVSVDPLVIDESAFTVELTSIQAQALDIPTAKCAPVDFDNSGTVDATDRALLQAAFVSAIDDGGDPEGLDFDGDGQITNADVAQAVFLLNRCSNEGPDGQPLIDVLDLTDDEQINIQDLVLFVEFILTSDPRADIDQSGTVDTFDVFTFIDAFDKAVLF